MKPLTFRFSSILLFVACALLAVSLVFGLVLLIGWPWWVGFFVFVGLAGLWLGLVFLKKIFSKRSAERFVHEVIAQDQTYIDTLGSAEKEAAKELQDRWKEAINVLKSSHLKKQGNPLYVLPWYLVMGESGTGKTTAIKSARLSSPFAEVRKASGISGTRNCDWWFFEQAIIIDTAGRYAIPVDEGRDKAEWEKFLAQLVKFRKKEPLNGLIVTVDAEKLLQGDTETLTNDGKEIRRRIDELMRVLSAKFPVYILVTKCDLVQGMTQFCDHLPENAEKQAMGVLNHDMSADVFSFSERAFNSIGNRLRDIRLLLLHETGAGGGKKDIEPELLLFPEEFERLKTGIDAFIAGAFQKNPYQETPLLRGLFFSSGRQEGKPFSHFLQALGLIDERETLPGTNRGLFLTDFFSRILPKDRKLFAPTQPSMHWRRLTRNMGLTSWIAIVIALCGLLSFSFVKNLKTLRVVSTEFPSPPALHGDILVDTSMMERFRQAILEVEAENNNWWIPRFGLDESIKVENRLKAWYCKQFKEGFLSPLNKQMLNRIAGFSGSTPDEQIGAHVIYLARCINMLNARLKGKPLDDLRLMPQPSYGPQIFVADHRIIPEIRKMFEGLYLYYLAWNKNISSLTQEKNDLHIALKHILTLKDSNLQWLIAWANRNPSLKSLGLKDFWGGSQTGDGDPVIPAAFTTKGRALIDSCIKEIEAALYEPLIIAASKQTFQKGYEDSYVKTWYSFGDSFDQGILTLKGKEEWQRVAGRVSAGKGPYASLFNVMSAELKPFKTANYPWIKLVYELETIREHALGLKAFEKTKGLGQGKASGLFARFENTKGNSKDEGEQKEAFEAQLAAARAFRDYQNALAALAPVSSSREAAYNAAVQVFNSDGSGDAPFFKAMTAINKIRGSVRTSVTDEDMPWKLMAGPPVYLLKYICRETACSLQHLWEKQVIMEVNDASDPNAVARRLFGQDGYAVRFIKGPAAPFIDWAPGTGYYPKEIMNTGVQFNEKFLRFIKKGSAYRSIIPKSSYSVTIQGLPSDTNRGALLSPYATHFTLQCSNTVQTIDNFNDYPRKRIIWQPSGCGGVTLKIDLENPDSSIRFSVQKHYKGFPEFLNDFRRGQKTFYPGNFPDRAKDLRRNHVRRINVKYRFRGHGPVLRLLQSSPGRVPKDITVCWD